MSLIDRRLRRWQGNLGRALGAVNRRPAAAARALALALVAACTTSSRPVPADANPEVPEYLGDARRAPFADEVIDTAPTRIWTAQVGRGSVGLPAVGDRIAAVATADRWVYALDTRTGRPFWRYRGEAPYGAGPSIGDGRVYVASEGREGRLTALSLRDGKRRWRVRVGDVAAPLVLHEGTVFGATQDGTAFAYAADDGEPRWTRTVGPTRSGPLVVGSRLAIVTLTDSLLVLDAGTGAVTSRAGLPTSTLAPLALVDDSTVAIASPAGALLAVDLPGGRPRWHIPTGAPIFGAPAVWRDTVFALTNQCTLWAVPVADPTRADTTAIGCVTVAGPTIVRDGVLIAAIGGEVIYFDRRSDRRVWTRKVQGELRHPPVVRRRQILVAPASGAVVSFR
jgi:outer membrane protein assembly factor BamB